MQVACAGDYNTAFISGGQGMLGYRLVFPSEGLSIDKGAIVERHGVADDVMRFAHRMRSTDGYFAAANLDNRHVQRFLTLPVAWVVLGK